MRNLKKILSMSLLVCMVLCSTIVSAGAVNVAEEKGSITALYLVDKKPVKDVSISIHRVASVNSDLEYNWLESFEKYKLTVDFNDDAKMAEVAQTIASYISRDSVIANATTKTNEDGYASFDGLAPGMYLITGDTFWSGQYSYHITPALIPLPYTDEKGNLSFDTNMELKHESQYHPDSNPQTIIRKVLKIWDVENEQNIPDSITVDLLRDGRLYESKDLNDRNNWTYTWRGLDDSHTWKVVEHSVPNGFTTSVSKQGVTYVITNTENPTTPPPYIPPYDPPEGPSNPPIGPTDPPSGPVDNPPVTPPSTDIPRTEEKLPQTGMLWWPVIVMAAISITFMVGAEICERKKKKLGKYLFLIVAMSLLAAAMFLTGRNIGEERNAGEQSDIVIQHMTEQIPNVYVDQVSTSEQIIPNYILNPGMDMPEMEVDGVRYIGMLEIPALELKLPVQSDWDKIRARTSPCRYVGSAYNDNLIIAGHNYKTHFAQLKSLVEGDEVIFTDIEGNVFHYQVTKTEVLDGSDITGMKAGDWDLTVFTCTIGGKQRVTIRCEAIPSKAV